MRLFLQPVSHKDLSKYNKNALEPDGHFVLCAFDYKLECVLVFFIKREIVTDGGRGAAQCNV